MKRWAFRIAAAVVGLVLVAGLVAYDFVRSFARSVPLYDGAFTAAGLAQPAQILRDRHGVPHIAAQSYDDAAFALGYAHAQDRLWQMELSRRFVQGRLAEVLGERALGADVLMRTLGL